MEAALADFQEATRLTPDDPEPWAWVAVILMQLDGPRRPLRLT